MANAAAAPLIEDDSAVVAQMARNIRSLGRQRGLFDKDVAQLIGMGAEKFSTRMSGDTRWLAIEVRRLARALNVSADVIYAEDETTFRAALAAERRATRSEKSQRRSDLRGLPRNTKPQRTKSLGSPLMTPV